MAIEKKEILKLAEKTYPEQVKLRRRLHQYPELSNEEFRTTEFIIKLLNKRRIKTIPIKLPTGTIAIINENKKTAVAVRTDIDALPLTEKSNLSFQSKRPGLMHACGHDIHAAAVLGTAFILNRLRKRIPGCVKFIFQPAEELPPGGAERMIKAGVLKNPDVGMIFGLHVDPTVATGKITLRDGPTMASVIDFDIIIYGTGGHAGLPHRAVDAIAVASEVIDSVQKIVSREINPLKPAVITFGSIKGGTVRNVIAEKVLLSGTARTLALENIRLLARLIRRTVDGVCRARGAKYEVKFLPGYPVLSNHKETNDILAETYAELFGRKNIGLTPQTMGGEDFAFYLEKTPGAMFRLGIKNKKIGADRPWHSPEFIADEKSIFYATALLSLAVTRTIEGV
jgi:amidohydrolase